jgi:3-hydroxyacyl-CoA dehydrogenase/enoyl-CoA hydratase/3-hydroxybutyryl-CoA epimerase
MPLEPQIHSRLATDGVLIATIDMPGRSMNVFSVELMDALDALLDQVNADAAIRSVVLTSGKSAFLAGADLVMVRGYTESGRTLNEEQMFELCGRLGRLFVRLEASAKPWVAAVNGLALGGGLELAMACRARLVSDDPRIQLGLPEVRWGLLPGAGGTQRLPRLAGFEAGLSLLLTGRSMAPQEAVERGVFERQVPAAELLEQACALAVRLQGQPFDASFKFAHLAQQDVPPCTDDEVRAQAHHHGVSDEQLRDYPAYSTIIRCVLLGARQALPEASATEMRQFLHLMFDPVAGNMIRTLFLNRQRADRELAAPAGLRVERITHGAWTDAAALWPEALARSRITLAEDTQLPPDTLVLQDTQGAQHRVRAGTLAGRDNTSADAEAVLTPAGPYGRVLEVVGASADSAAALAALAPRIGALPYRSGDGLSVMRRLNAAPAAPLDARALAALRLLDSGAAPQADILDVAAAAANLYPAYTGGPLTCLWQQRERLLPLMDGDTRAAWERQQQTLKDLGA